MEVKTWALEEFGEVVEEAFGKLRKGSGILSGTSGVADDNLASPFQVRMWSY